MRSNTNHEKIKVEVNLPLDNQGVTEEEIKVVEAYLEDLIKELLWAGAAQ